LSNLITKYRPKSLDEVWGNEQVVSTLKGFKKKGKFPQAMLFKGQGGTGKTTLARIVAKELGALGNDLIEVNVADNNGVDYFRDLIEKTEYSPLSSPVKVFILDECHALTTSSQNALLKVLEEPPSYCYFILCTTDPSKLLPTVQIRCTQFTVDKFDLNTAMDFIDEICMREWGYASVDDSPMEDEFIKRFTLATDGYPRRILSELEKIVVFNPVQEKDKINSYTFEDYTDDKKIENLVKMMIQADKWEKVNEEIGKIDIKEIEGVRRGILNYLTKMMCSGNYSLIPRHKRILNAFSKPFFDKGTEKAMFINAVIEAIGG
jgi:DNA polymerase III gamma/tau subunit